MMCSLMDPIHIFEMPRMCYNVILNSVSLPIFFAVSVFQREMEIPTLPIESVVEFFTNGRLFACCTRTPGIDDWRSIHKCRLGADCHTKRVRDMLIRMLNHRAWLPKMSGVSLNFMSNATPYLTGYGDQVLSSRVGAGCSGRLLTGNTHCFAGGPLRHVVAQVVRAVEARELHAGPLDYRSRRQQQPAALCCCCSSGSGRPWEQQRA